MAVCPKCGVQVEEKDKFCPACGAPLEDKASDDARQFTENAKVAFEKLNDTKDETNTYDPEDIASNKTMGVLSYLSWLVLIPIFGAKDSPFARFHANQGLVLAILELLWGVVIKILKWILGDGLLGGILSVANALMGIAMLILVIIGIVNVVNGRAKELPIIGQFRFLN